MAVRRDRELVARDERRGRGLAGGRGRGALDLAAVAIDLAHRAPKRAGAERRERRRRQQRLTVGAGQCEAEPARARGERPRLAEQVARVGELVDRAVGRAGGAGVGLRAAEALARAAEAAEAAEALARRARRAAQQRRARRGAAVRRLHRAAGLQAAADAAARHGQRAAARHGLVRRRVLAAALLGVPLGLPLGALGRRRRGAVQLVRKGAALRPVDDGARPLALPRAVQHGGRSGSGLWRQLDALRLLRTFPLGLVELVSSAALSPCALAAPGARLTRPLALRGLGPIAERQ